MKTGVQEMATSLIDIGYIKDQRKNKPEVEKKEEEK